MKKTRIYNLQQLYDALSKCVGLLHVAVDRFKSLYSHHYVINVKESVRNVFFKIIHYTGGLKYFFTGSTCGKVVETKHPVYEVENEIEKGLYIIEDGNYPKTVREMKDACERYLWRLGERAYHLVYNNCEHFANYVMTGKPRSEQIRKADKGKKMIADTFDMTFNDGKSNFAKTMLNRTSTVAARQFIQTASRRVLLQASKITLSDAVNTAATGYAARNLIKYAGSFRNAPPVDCMLASQPCCDVANQASRTALKKAALATGAVTCLTEACFAAWEIKNLRKLKRDGKIEQREYNREVTKKVVTVPVATAGTVAGSVIGQAICPMPVVGAFIGGLVGSVVGRWVAGIGTGAIFDWLF